MQVNSVMTRTINVLNAMAAQGAKFYIELPDGSKYGNIQLQKPKAKKQMRPYGSVKGAINPYLIGMQVGDVALIPIPATFKRSAFQSAVATRALKLWGTEAHTSCITDNGVEVMRTA